jgi:sporulenol synthase
LTQVKDTIQRLAKQLEKGQYPDGTWRYCFESGIMTDAYMIILLRTLKFNDERLIKKLGERILHHQKENGAWKLFRDEADGNLSATIEAYYALLYSGLRTAGHDRMQAAKQFILAKGGLNEADLMTKVMLALTGNYKWPSLPFVPLEIILLPPTFPIHFYDFVGYTRVHVAPILLAWDQQFSLKTKRTPDLSGLVVQGSIEGIGFQINRSSVESKGLHQSIKNGIKSLPYLPEQIHQIATQQMERFIRERIEPDGTLYSYFSSSFLMIFGLLAKGYSVKHPVIIQAVKGLQKLTTQAEGGLTHIENSTSTVWDTALISHTLQEAGLSSASDTIQKSSSYLLARQHDKYGDWKVHNPAALPGGWGFSDINTMNPDVDDTTSALRALKHVANTDQAYQKACKRGLQWLLSMQNTDGGWPAFEKNTDKKMLQQLPSEELNSILTDPSSADLTGRTLEFLGTDEGMSYRHTAVQRGVKWLLKNQEKDGSWYGRWGVCYTYGTWAAVTGMSAVGIPAMYPNMKRAVKWMLSIQNEDGGWGESCKSDTEKKYIPLGASTLSQTAWMVDALISVYKKPTPAIERGIDYLIRSIDKTDWTTSYPTGGGLPGGFYIHYHSYRYIWPLLALSHYQKKYGETSATS